MTTVLPNTLIIGAQKSGTTWLARRLAAHQDTYVAPREVDFFNNEDHFAAGTDWYGQFFEGQGDKKIRVDKTADYLWTTHPTLFCQKIPERIAATLPDAKLIVALREPVARLVSALNHHIEKGRIAPHADFDSLLLGEDRAVGERFGLISHGFYADQLEVYFDHFSRAQVKVFVYEEDIVKAPDNTLSHLAAFVGLDEAGFGPASTKRDNRRMNTKLGQRLNHRLPALRPLIAGIDRLLPRKAPLGPSDTCQTELHQLFSPQIDRLEALLDRDLSAWRHGDG